MPARIGGGGGGRRGYLPSPASFSGSPTERLFALRQMKRQEAERRFAAGTGPDPDAPEDKPTPSERSAEALARALSSGTEEGMKIARDYWRENKGVIDPADIEALGLTESVQALDAGSDEPPAWQRFASKAAAPLEILSRPGQAALEGLEAASNTLREAGAPNIHGDEGGSPSAGYGDIWKALKGEARTAPDGRTTKNLTLGDVLGVEAPESGPRRLAYNITQFGGEAAMDPLNLVGAGGAKAAERGLGAAARTVAADAAEGGAEALSPRLARALAREGVDVSEGLTEDAALQALRRTGIGDRGILVNRRALTAEQRAATREALIQEAAEARTTRGLFGGSGRTVAGRGDRALGYRALTGRGRRTGAERFADRALESAERYGRGGLRIAGRSVLGGREGAVKAGQATRLIDEVAQVPESERVDRILDDASGEAWALREEAARLREGAEAAGSGSGPGGIARVRSALEESGAVAEADARGLLPDGTPALVSPDARRVLDGPQDPGASRELSEALRLERKAQKIEEAVDTGSSAAVLKVVPGAGSATQATERVVRPGFFSGLKRSSGGSAARTGFVPRAQMASDTSLPEGFADTFYGLESQSRAMFNTNSDQVARRIAQAGKAVSPEDRALVLEALDAGDLDAVDRLARQGKTEAADYLSVLESVEMEDLDRLIERGIIKAPGEEEVIEDLIRPLPRTPTEVGARALRLDQKRGLDIVERSGVDPTDPGTGILDLERRLGDPLREQGALRKGFLDRLRGRGRTGDQLLEQDPGVLAADRALRTRLAESQAFLADELGKMSAPDGGTLAARIKPGDAKAAERAKAYADRGLEKVTVGNSEVWVHPSIKPEFDRVGSVVQEDEAIGRFGQFMDNWNTMWKGYATIPLVSGPSFMSRNMTGNIFANYLAGVRNPDVYRRALVTQSHIGEAVKEFPDMDIPAAVAAKYGDEEAAVVEAALEQGVLDEGFASVDLAKIRQPDLTPRRGKGKIAEALNPADRRNLLLRTGSNVNAVVENNARLAHFMDQIDKGASVADAGASVKKYLFDYSDLTKFEQQRMKYAVAFWTYMRKNTPLMVKETLQQPARVRRAQEFTDVLMDQDEEQQGEGGRLLGLNIPQWAAERGGLLSDSRRQALGAQGPVFGAVDTPFSSAAEAFSPLNEAVALAQGGSSGEELARALINPLSGGPVEAGKIVAEEATGTSLFTGASLSDEEEGRKKNVVLRLSQAVAPAADKFVRTYGIESVAGNETGTTAPEDSSRMRLLKALTGVQLREVRPDDADANARYLTNELEDALEEVEEETGTELPSLEELRQVGLLPPSPEEAARAKPIPKFKRPS